MRFQLGIQVLIIICLGTSRHRLVAQTADFPRDTSYTLYSSYKHLLKRHTQVTPIHESLPKGVGEKRNVVYAKLGERELHLDIFSPAKKKRKGCPAILMIHGGGWSSGSKEMEVPMAQQLAARGYVTIPVEYRLSPEAIFPAAVYDLKAAVRWIRAHAAEYGINPKKIAVYGCSAGAQLAALIAATNGLKSMEGDEGYAEFSSEVQAVLSIDGIVSFVHPEADEEGKAASKWLDGSRTENWTNWKAASALEYANEHIPPFLFVNSAAPRFHAGRDDMIKILTKAGTYYEVHEIPDSPHSFWTVHPWFEETFTYSTDFLKKVF